MARLGRCYWRLHDVPTSVGNLGETWRGKTASYRLPCTRGTLGNRSNPLEMEGLTDFFSEKSPPFSCWRIFQQATGWPEGCFSAAFRPSGLLCWDVAPGPGDGVPGERTSELATTRMAWTLEGALFRSILTVRSLRRPGVDVVSLRWALNFVDFLGYPMISQYKWIFDDLCSC